MNGSTTATSVKYVYSFGGGTGEGNKEMKALLGGKGANLAEMSAIGLPVPPGFTVSTEACKIYDEQGGKWPGGLHEQVEDGIRKLEQNMNATFGDPSNPLLVSVRSGAAISMPGMMDTVLNLGLNDASVEGLARLSGDARFAWDAYRRLINMYGDVVMGVDHEHFEEAFDDVKLRYGVKLDTDVPVEGMQALCDAYKSVYQKHVGKKFPQDPLEQLRLAVEAVFKSWNTQRAARYCPAHSPGR